MFLFLCSFNRGLFIIDSKGILRQITMNDLPVSGLPYLVLVSFPDL